MGHNHSLPIPRYGWCISSQHSDLESHVRKRDHGSREFKKSRHRRNLSAAFSFSPESVAGDAIAARDATETCLASPTSWSTCEADEFRSSIWSSDTATELVNINTATEEELMTLRGVTRTTARAIVEHRVAISGYRRIEDLALVSGVGATHLQVIRDEICVSPRGRGDYRGSKLSRRSSTTSSGIDISGTTSMDSRVTDVVPGTHLHSTSNGETARSLHNEKYSNDVHIGQSFARTEAKASCTDHSNSGSIISNGIIKPCSLSENATLPNLRDRDIVKSGPGLTTTNRLSAPVQGNTSCGVCMAIYGSSNGGFCIPRTSPSLPKKVKSKCNVMHSYPSTEERNENVRLSYGSPGDEFFGQYGPLLQRSGRTKSSSLTFSSKEPPMLRMGAWSLDGCSRSKPDNPGVREVIAMTILENRLTVVALHDLIDTEYALNKFCDELNNPVVPTVMQWSARRGHWRYAMSSSQPSLTCGFLYDSEAIRIISSETDGAGVQLINYQMSALSLCAATFSINSVKITFCSFLRTDQQKEGAENLAWKNDVHQLLETIQKDVTRSIVLAGDCDVNLEKQWLPLSNQSTVTHASESAVSAQAAQCSNMWLNKTASAFHSGHMKMICDGLTSPWIPKGSWGWGGSLSSYCPVYAELSVPLFEQRSS